MELFQEPKKNLYQRNAIKMENIEKKNKYIVKKITNITHKIENSNLEKNFEKSLEKRDEFLYIVGTLAREAQNYSYELFEKIIGRFYIKNKFNSIIYERAKIELSSWANQSLIINNTITGIKDSRYFYEFYCNNYVKYFKGYKESLEQFLEDLKNEKYYFNDLFRDLCQLYTEVLLYSEKNIELIYIDNNYKYMKDLMEDITDLNGGRNVKATILPGLFVNSEPINNGKILVYCENQKSQITFNKFFQTPKKEK